MMSTLQPDDNKGSEILISCGVCVGVAMVTVGLRSFVRLKWTRNFGWDDYFIVAAMIVMFTEMMIIIPEVQLGAGRHVEYIEPKTNIPRGLHLNFVTQPLCLIALCLTKISVGFFLLRLTPSRAHARVIWIIMVFTVLSWAGNFLTIFFQCRPLSMTWGATTSGTCMKPSHLKFAAFFNSSVSALTDLLFALLPIPFLWKVQINKRTKIAIIAILSLGIFVAVSAVIKMLYLSNYGKHGDFLYDSSELTIWTTVEICTAIVAACAPCLKPLFRRVLESTLLSNIKSRHNRHSFGRDDRPYDRVMDPKLGQELQYRSKVSAGESSSKTESQEAIVVPGDGIYASKTFSVSVK